MRRLSTLMAAARADLETVPAWVWAAFLGLIAGGGTLIALLVKILWR